MYAIYLQVARLLPKSRRSGERAPHAATKAEASREILCPKEELRMTVIMSA